MPVIRISTFIRASAPICFDMARSIDIHMESTAHTNERAVEGQGCTCGLIEWGETVTWEATHFGIRWRLTSKITEFDPPATFTDEMVRGPFRRFRHVHTFESREGGTWMADRFDYTSPFGVAGKLADAVFLRSYMERLLLRRNQYVKQAAEQLASREP